LIDRSESCLLLVFTPDALYSDAVLLIGFGESQISSLEQKLTRFITGAVC
jgi:hypothetical protein